MGIISPAPAVSSSPSTRLGESQGFLPGQGSAALSRVFDPCSASALVAAASRRVTQRQAHEGLVRARLILEQEGEGEVGCNRGEGLGIPSPHFGCHTGSGCCLRSTVDFWEMISGLFSYSASLGSTVVTCLALSHLFLVSNLLLPFPALFGTTVASCYVSLQRPGNFTHFLREGRPRILIGRSIPAGWFCRLRCTSCCVSFGCPMRVPFAGQVVRARRCAATGAGGSDIAPRCPWRLHRRISWTRLWALRQVLWSRQCKLSGGAAVAAHLQGH